MDEKEVVWRIKSRALWLEKGDENKTKIHHFTNQCEYNMENEEHERTFSGSFKNIA